MGDVYEYRFKVIVVGDSGAGKTSIIRRYVQDKFVASYKSTIGLDFSVKNIKWDETSEVVLQLWDIAGQERFRNMTRSYYKGAVGAIVVFDVTREETYLKNQAWKQDIDKKVMHNGKPIPTLLMANKCDMQVGDFMKDRTVLDEYCETHNFIGWYETSAKDNVGIDAAIKNLVSKLMADAGHMRANAAPAPGSIRLGERRPAPPPEDSSCSC
mmetsp:Transcript_346/g.1208  ORF Transcript_346/g.1208 Transcript_346/m.1208 type:complete len:212 (+) Transcript_346:73-708(+)